MELAIQLSLAIYQAKMTFKRLSSSYRPWWLYDLQNLTFFNLASVSTGVRTERICQSGSSEVWCMVLVHTNYFATSFIKFKIAFFQTFRYVLKILLQCTELSIHRCSCLLVRVHVSCVHAFIFRKELCERTAIHTAGRAGTSAGVLALVFLLRLFLVSRDARCVVLRCAVLPCRLLLARLELLRSMTIFLVTGDCLVCHDPVRRRTGLAPLHSRFFKSYLDQSRSSHFARFSSRVSKIRPTHFFGLFIFSGTDHHHGDDDSTRIRTIIVPILFFFMASQQQQLLLLPLVE
jgi:hypothetical protein